MPRRVLLKVVIGLLPFLLALLLKLAFFQGFSTWFFITWAGTILVVWVPLQAFLAWTEEQAKSELAKIRILLNQTVEVSKATSITDKALLKEINQWLIDRIKEVHQVATNRNSQMIRIEEIFSCDDMMKAMVARIRGYYEHTKPHSGHPVEFRVTFMQPSTFPEDELTIVYWDNKNNQIPGTKQAENGFRFKRPTHKEMSLETSCCGLAWVTGEAVVIEDVEMELRKQRGRRFTRVPGVTNELVVKSMFSLPVSDLINRDGKFYGVLNVDCNQPGWFKETKDGLPNPVIEEMQIFKHYIALIYKVTDVIREKYPDVAI